MKDKTELRIIILGFVLILLGTVIFPNGLIKWSLFAVAIVCFGIGIWSKIFPKDKGRNSR